MGGKASKDEYKPDFAETWFGVPNVHVMPGIINLFSFRFFCNAVHISLHKRYPSDGGHVWQAIKGV